MTYVTLDIFEKFLRVNGIVDQYEYAEAHKRKLIPTNLLPKAPSVYYLYIKKKHTNLKLRVKIIKIFKKKHGREYNPINKNDQKLYRKIYSQIPERRAISKAYRQTPKVKAYEKEYRLRPENKARQRVHKQTPEYKAKFRVYRQRPKVKARERLRKQTPEYMERANFLRRQSQGLNTIKYRVRKRVYNQTPEIKARKRAYEKEYRLRPEVKAKIRARSAAYYQRQRRKQ